mmetsp:Transcript_57003/g.157785  ORF Transcript_57003/g.157785 Transcript_57003/m.157785 type:complete len:205 (-) Transcript_57003:382-996(-)
MRWPTSSPAKRKTPVVWPPVRELNCARGCSLRWGARRAKRFGTGKSCTPSMSVTGTSAPAPTAPRPGSPPAAGSNSGDSAARLGPWGSASSGEPNGSPGAAPSSNHWPSCCSSLVRRSSTGTGSAPSSPPASPNKARCLRVMPGLGTGSSVSRIHCGSESTRSSITAFLLSSFLCACRRSTSRAVSHPASSMLPWSGSSCSSER